MGQSAITIFIVFFGIALLTALREGHWSRAAFWLAIFLAFYAMDRTRRARNSTGARSSKRE